MDRDPRRRVEERSDESANDEIGWGETDVLRDVERLEKELTRLEGVDSAQLHTHIKHLVTREPSWRDVAKGLFDGAIWGTIHWRRGLGRPRSERLSDAFTIRHMYEELDWVIGADGKPIPTGGWKDGAQPWLWDGVDDDEHHFVNFRLRGVHPWRNAVGVNLRPDVTWGPPVAPWLAPQRRVQYPESLLPLGIFRVNATGTTELDDIEVVRLLT